MKCIDISGTRPYKDKKRLAKDLESLLPDYFTITIGKNKNALGTTRPDCHIDYSTPPHSTDSKEMTITSFSRISEPTIASLGKSLGLPEALVRKIAWLCGARPEAVSAIILIGGKSSRMGRDKALLEIKGEQAVYRLQRILSPFFDTVMLSTGPNPDYTVPGLKTVTDISHGHGPLMGIYSSLLASQTPINFFIACDIPEVKLPLIFKLLSYADDYDISLPSFDEDRFEPLYGIYRKEVVPVIKTKLDSGKRRVASIFDMCKTVILPMDDSSWYTNLNTPDDYENYLHSLGKKSD